MKPAAKVATLFLTLISLAHLLRILFNVPITLGSMVVPVWASLLAVLGTGLLAVWLWREQQS